MDSSLFAGLAPGFKFLGSLGKFLKTFGNIANPVNGLVGSISFSVVEVGRKVVQIDINANYPPGYLESLGFDPKNPPRGFDAQLDPNGKLIGFSTAEECFLSGTPITMADGSTKPIEEVQARGLGVVL